MVAKPSTTERKVMKPRAERAPLNIRHLKREGGRVGEKGRGCIVCRYKGVW